MAPHDQQTLATWPEAELDEAALMAALEASQRTRFADKRNKLAELAGL